jgi:hypothetical protein
VPSGGAQISWFALAPGVRVDGQINFNFQFGYWQRVKIRSLLEPDILVIELDVICNLLLWNDL